ncbi:MAG: ATP-binding protein, partial [Gammaproteobacteria bacterium]|nr:ATP-binding protein [Gammaproteobacteria bacterium]
MATETFSNIVRLNGRFIRSARIDMDLTGSPPLEGYILQASTKKSLFAITTSISEGGQCAFTWSGPYGVGKSSTALLLGNLVAGTKKGKLLARKIAGPCLSQAFEKAFDPSLGTWSVLPVTGSRKSIRDTLAEKMAERYNWTRAKQRRIS